MTKFRTIKFTGISDKSYEFTAYSWDTIFKNNCGAVYFVTKRSRNANGGYTHIRIYVGQTEDLSTRFDNHHKQTCFDKYGANCICVLGEQNENKRLMIEQDLIKKYHPPCND